MKRVIRILAILLLATMVSADMSFDAGSDAGKGGYSDTSGCIVDAGSGSEFYYYNTNGATESLSGDYYTVAAQLGVDWNHANAYSLVFFEGAETSSHPVANLGFDIHDPSVAYSVTWRIKIDNAVIGNTARSVFTFYWREGTGEDSGQGFVQGIATFGPKAENTGPADNTTNPLKLFDTVFTMGVWHDVTLTLDATTATARTRKVYLDGVEIQDITWASYWNYNAAEAMMSFGQENPDVSSTYSIDYVTVTQTTNVENKATYPQPVDASTDVDVDTVLSWRSGALASSHDIYIGTSLDEVTNADRNSPTYMGNQSASDPSTYDPDLGYGATYYWRIDEVNDSDVPEWPGDVWSFTTTKTEFPVAGDLNGDNLVNISDLNIFASQWLNGPGCPTPDCADFDGVNGVDLEDFVVIADNWHRDTPPVITLIGDAVVTVTVGSTYIDDGAVANDLEDGDITSDIVVYNPVDTSTVGVYTITYNVTDSGSNAAEEVTREVHVIADTVAPVITLIGENPINIPVGSTYSDPGATAQDDVDGNITANIVVDNPVDTSVAGVYTVRYNVSDAAGNAAEEVTRTVNVTNLAVVNIQNDFEDAASNYDPLSSSSPIHRYATGLSSSQITFNHFGADSDTPDGSAKSFYIDADIHGISSSQSWYYYFALPLPAGTTNLHGTLAASFDIKLDANATALTTISIDEYGYPIAGKVIVGEGFASDTANTWQKVNLRDIARNFKIDAPYAFVGYQTDSPYYFLGEACDIQLDDIGRRLSCLMIRLVGTGPKTFKIRVDNYSLTGTQMDPTEWYNTYIDGYTYPAWHAYHDRVDDKIDQVEARLNALEDLPTLPASPSDKQDYRYKKLTFYKNRIASDISAMRSGNAYRTGYGSWCSYKLLQEANDFLARYESTIGALKKSITSPASDFVAYKVDPMKYGYLDGYTFPMVYSELDGYNLRMARGERKSIAMLLDPAPGYNATLTFENTDFTDGTHSFAASNLDTYVAKIWYQAGRYETRKVAGNKHFLTQELLLKNENLVRVIHSATEREGEAWGENELWVTNTDGSNGRYINISTPSSVADPTFPDPRTIKFNDTEELQPFTLNNTYKLLWSIVRIPESTPAGTYTSTITIKQGSTVVKSIPITVEVLPFDLSAPRELYGVYYHGKLIAGATDASIMPLDAHQKTHAQQTIELQDMFDHGVLYPGHYENDIRVLDDTLAIQNSIGFPKDRFYSLGLLVRTYTTLSQVQAWQDVLVDYGYDPTGLFMYGQDEAPGPELAELIDVTENVVYAAGAKVFCAIYSSAFDHVGNYMDAPIYGYGTHAPGIEKQIADWHSAGQEIYAYSDPQAGVENPEIYRRDYGLRMIELGFDGAFDYAYQKIYGVFWNDFDTKTSESARREEAFTYPTTNGIVGTVQWEGYATAITDARYLATLKDIRDQLDSEGEDVSAIDNFIANINTDDDLDTVRDSIIDEILSLI